MCSDGTFVRVPRKTANVRDLDETNDIPASGVRYAKHGKTHELMPSITVSGVEYSPDMTKILGGSDGIRTIIFPKIIKTIRQKSFYGVEALR